MSTLHGAFRHSCPVQVRFNDVDMLGHVNNAVHQNFYDLARLKYFRDVIGEEIDWKVFSVVMVSIKIEYYGPVRLNDKVYVRSRTEMIGEKSLTMVQELVDASSREIKSSNRAVMVGYSPVKKQSEAIPSDWKNSLMAYEDQISLKYPVGQN